MKKIIIASGPVIVEKNKVLLNDHGDTRFWKFCGGSMKDSELSLLEVARREVKEEMGIGIEILEPEPFITHTTKNGIDVILVHWLAMRIGEIKPGSDIRQWDWFDISRLPDNLAPNIIPTLRHFGFLK